MEKKYCMIVADIVSSQEIDLCDRAKLQETLRNTLERINYDYQSIILTPFIITLGDEFQGALYDSSKALEILEKIKYEIAPNRIRVGIGINRVRTAINIESSFGTDGDAYYGARQEIEKLKKQETYQYGYSFSTGNDDEILLNELFRYLDQISKNWTEKQNKYTINLDSKENLTKIAARMNVDVSTVSRTLKRSRIPIIRKTLINVSEYLYEKYSIGEDQDKFIRDYNYITHNFKTIDFDAIIKLFEYNLDQHEKILLFTLFASLLNKRQKYDEAISQAKQAMKLIQSGDYNQFRIKLIHIIACSYLSNKKYDRAIEEYNKAFSVIDYEKNVKYWRFQVLGNLAYCYLYKEDYKKAEKYYNAANNILKSAFSKDYNDDIRLRILYAKLLFKKGEHQNSIKELEETLNYAQMFLDNDESSIGVILHCLAEFLTNSTIGDSFDKIENYITQSNRIFFKLQQYKNIIENCEIMIQCSKKFGNAEKEKEYKEKKDEIQKKIGG